MKMNNNLRKKKPIKFLLKLIVLLKIKLINNIFKLPYLQKPYPKKPFGKKIKASKKIYLDLFKRAKNKDNKKVVSFESECGFAIDPNWFDNLCLVTQTCLKESELNFNHGRILYSLLSKYINDINIPPNNKNITIFETGTARGFSSLCMSKAINDQKFNGKIITLDCIGHNERIFWNCISDHEGKKTREELLKNWNAELSNIIFFQGWTNEILNRIGISRINFAFLDAQHTKKDVLKEFNYVSKKQKKGDIILIDDVTPNLFSGVCEAIKDIEKIYPYSIKILDFDKNRGYAIATRINNS